MRKLLALLGICFMAGAVAAPVNKTPFQFACDELAMDCTALASPTIIYTKLLNSFGVYGAYVRGEPYVFISPTAPTHTIAHEMTHYILYNLGYTKILTLCEGEELARRVHHAWDETEYNDDWRPQYGCPT